jgi:hypothetical protein
VEGVVVGQGESVNCVDMLAFLGNMDHRELEFEE